MPAPIVFLEVDHKDATSILEQYPDAVIHAGVLTDDRLIEACTDAEIVCCFIYSAFTARVIGALPKLRLLCTRSVGVNHIDLVACQERGITVCNVPDYGSHVIAEHAFAMLLTALRHITEAGQAVRQGIFDYHGLRGMALMGKTIGIVGTGKIGRSVAMIARGFGMRVLAVDKCRVLELQKDYRVQYVDLPTLLAESDIISLHIPATPETMHLLNDDTIGHMKDGAIIINTARGELIDTAALLSALRTGKVARALLDVLEDERDPEKNRELIAHPNVLVTPHIAFYADESMARMYADCFTSIREFSAGEHPGHAVSMPTLVCDLPAISSRRAR